LPRYFMHLVDGADILLDPDGTEISPEAVASTALVQARDCLAGDAKNGHLDLSYRIEVHDESGQVIHCLEFADAVQISGACLPTKPLLSIQNGR
jgi:hypothetical protein